MSFTKVAPSGQCQTWQQTWPIVIGIFCKLSTDQLIMLRAKKDDSRVAKINSRIDFVAVDVWKLFNVTLWRKLTLNDAAKRPKVGSQTTDEGLVDGLDHFWRQFLLIFQWPDQLDRVYKASDRNQKLFDVVLVTAVS